METLQHHLAAVWFADIVGYTRMAAEDEERALRVVRVFQEAAREVVRRHEGRVVKFIGDAALASFRSGDAAVRAACRLPSALAEHAAQAGLEAPALRIAVHVGEVAETQDGDVYGDGVNLAARAVREAAPGEVWVSQDMWRHLRHRPRFRFETRGARELKGLGTVEFWSVACGEEEPEPAVGPGARARALVRSLDRQRPAVIGVLAVVVAVAAWLILPPDRPTRTEATGADRGEAALDPSRIAVLYFQDRTPSDPLGDVAGGLTEAIIDQLSDVEGLDVVSRYAVEPLRNRIVPLDSLGRALGAGTLVDGTLQPRGDSLLVTVRLIDGTDGSQIARWSEGSGRSAPFSLQGEIAENIVTLLRRRLGERLRMEARRSQTSSVEALELVQRAERLADQARLTDKDDPGLGDSLRQRADEFLVRAEMLDPRWIEPTVVRAEIAAWMGGEPSYRRGLEHAERALAKKPGSARALAVRGALYDSLASTARDSITAARHLARAERDLRTAVSIDPGLASGWIALADLLYNDLGELAEARADAQRAYEADPFLLENDHFAWLCEISFQLGDYEQVARWCGEGRRKFPDRIRLTMVELSMLASDNFDPDVTKAWELVHEIGLQEYPEFNVAVARMVTATVLARAGLADSARAVVAETRRTAPDEVAPFLDVFEARLQLVLGDRPSAIRLLRSFLTAAPSYRAQLAHDPWFEVLAGEPAFEALVDRKHAPIFCRLLCQAP